MARYQHQICLVSHENAPEIIGALHPGVATAHIHALVTPKMREQSARLAAICRQHGIRYDAHNLEKIDISAIGNALDALWASAPDDSWAVNITGGTKIMALAAYSWAIANKFPAFYVDTDNGEILVFSESRREAIPLQDILNLKQLLCVYGYAIKSSHKSPLPQNIREVLAGFISLLDKASGKTAFGILNNRAKTAEDSRCLDINYRPAPCFAELLELCKKAGKLDFTDSAIIFRDETARSWCKGIWLEEYIQAVLAGLEGEGKINSWAASVQVTQGNVPNELDAVFTASNRLYVIECKTGKMRQSESGEQQATGILYKADSLNKRLGGIYTRTMLCSVNSLEKYEQERADSLKLKVVTGQNLKNLRKIIIEWTGRA